MTSKRKDCTHSSAQRRLHTERTERKNNKKRQLTKPRQPQTSQELDLSHLQHRQETLINILRGKK